MKWTRLGKLFDPADHAAALNGGEFAKSPQALVLQDRVRIYFCTQTKTANGKYVSRPYFVDFDRALREIIEVSTQPVIDLGRLGEFDEHGIFPFSVLQANDQLLAYTSGWSRRNSVSIEMSIGLARSSDGGRTFTKHGSGGPIMTINQNEPCLVGDAFVQHYKHEFHMWYIYGDRWVRPTHDAAPERFYRIAHATSADGVDWVRDGRKIIPAVSADECQALPSVVFHAGRFHMYFCYRSAFDFRANRQHAYRLGYAWSDDLTSWQRDDSLGGIELSNDGWDSEMMCYPNLFLCDGSVFMLYNGNEFGRHGFGLARLCED
jgi:hypothetical protein